MLVLCILFLFFIDNIYQLSPMECD